VLKPKGYFIMNVMDLRKKSNFYPLHIDASTIAKEVGFSFEDIIIWDRQPEYNNMRPLGYPYKFIVNKVHEYLLILRKPE
jgi:DNA modification methylase